MDHTSEPVMRQTIDIRIDTDERLLGDHLRRAWLYDIPAMVTIAGVEYPIRLTHVQEREAR